MNHNVIRVTCSILLVIGNIQILRAEDDKTQQSVLATATQEKSTTTPKPKINIKDSDVCKKCSCDIEALQIDCSNKSMTTLFTADDWKTLQNGDLFFNIIKMEHNEISYIPELPTYPVKSLFLSSNKINNISMGAFKNLSLLMVLDLSNNKLTSKSLTPHIFKGMYATDKYEPLKNLKSLNLANNELHTLKSDIFEHLPALETLILAKNTFHVIDTSTTVAIASLSSLKTLDLSYIEIKEVPDTIFHGPNELETLILTGNLFSSLPSALAGATHLKKLILDENPLTDIKNDNVFKSLGELKYLSISYLPDITKIGAWAFSDLQNLTTLVAIYNPHLSHIHELAFTKNTTNPDIFDYPPLTELLLHNNNLTRIERNWIVQWQKITSLDLRFNPWHCDCSNSWLIHAVMKQINNTSPMLTNDVRCASPANWKNKPLLKLSSNKNEFLCESNSQTKSLSGSFSFVGILLGMLIGLLIGIVISFKGAVIYQKVCCGFLNRRQTVADRSLYNRASFADDFHI